MNTENRSNSAPFSNSDADDREWQCLRYVLGEMSAAETEAFEELLATDQETRERAASCVALVGSLFSAIEPRSKARPAVVSANSKSARVAGHRGRWSFAAAVAVCVAAIAGLYVFAHKSPRSFESPYVGRTLDGGDGLVAMWSELLSDSTVDPDAPEMSLSEHPGQPMLDESEDELVAEDDRPAEAAGEPEQAAKDFQVPGWLIAAVSNDEKHDSDNSVPEVREN
jgi:hypothetical protein